MADNAHAKASIFCYVMHLDEEIIIFKDRERMFWAYKNFFWLITDILQKKKFKMADKIKMAARRNSNTAEFFMYWWLASNILKTKKQYMCL